MNNQFSVLLSLDFAIMGASILFYTLTRSRRVFKREDDWGDWAEEIRLGIVLLICSALSMNC